MKRILSGIKPSSEILHLGHYFGALKQWVGLQKTHTCLFPVVDLHALTIPQDPQKLRESTTNVAKTYLAVGLDPKKSVIFKQSDVVAHLELFWILNTITKVSELLLMTQYKDRVQKNGPQSALAGLLNYPVLMAADILLYDTNFVPVGDDQVQHIELAREIARRFNQKFGQTFVIPQPMVEKIGARIMSLDDPAKKMSKSDSNPNSCIALTDKPAVIREKIKRAVTDSGKEVKYDPKKKPGISNLLTILSLVLNVSIKSLEKKYKGAGYGRFKSDVADTLVRFLSDFQNKYNKISDARVKKVLADGARKARKTAEKKIEEVYKKVGLK
ncbi:MAG: tryptophanyl-tRNA synthetase, tryptophanyl-tRNA synthetase [Candidatus Wolfebacteria bacterium GW2011_GWC1_43_10]|uniref:Tryptophan--tRNA ligase n=2 Tax=Candidatus Wolfeibacteriota TaxID=1752735 RepID=A0A0G1CAU4_9BACT|nr:MAG: tryptophanyl-tRNA synthetase, tryptophanyl-tRNA synthetase [Candidatus Wolfebacteria bacterium GW2011_GWC1_43_10]KKT23167.1 MAG: Tryptophan-tRNA ligase [Parcubacteria group bacterium GW2011_GWB1_43_8b]OGM89282.1 MAG: tryptophan--tRNA ligase [Candidatus Wolfebacteria bacterium GWA1_42_9]